MMGMIVGEPEMVVVRRVGRALAVLRDTRTELTEAAMSVFVEAAAAAVETEEMAEATAEDGGTTTVTVLADSEVTVLADSEATAVAVEGVFCGGGEATGLMVMGAIVTGTVGCAEKTEKGTMMVVT